MSESMDNNLESMAAVQAERSVSEDLVQTVEALLFAAYEPLPPSTLTPTLNGSSAATLEKIMVEINVRLAEGKHPMRVRKVAGGFQMYVLPEFGPAIEAALVKTKIQRLSRAALETLAIIAYKQPCSTPDMEMIRGVSCSGVLSTLLERNLVTIAGRSEGPGRPLLYRTTREFLEYFGLNSLDDLPRVEELEAILAERESEAMISLNLDGTSGEDLEGRHGFMMRRAPEVSPAGMGEFVIRNVRVSGVDAGEENPQPAWGNRARHEMTDIVHGSSLPPSPEDN
jgi:segregation and condensation protein B